jgi:hypothetical protein
MTAHAEWKYFDSADRRVTYLDYDRVESDGLYKYIYELSDYKFRGRSQSKSTIYKFLIDCQSQAIQLVGTYEYSEYMATGRLMDSTNYPIDKSQWAYPQPNANNDLRKYINIACSRK